jgi:hypothetical protein
LIKGKESNGLVVGMLNHLAINTENTIPAKFQSLVAQTVDAKQAVIDLNFYIGNGDPRTGGICAAVPKKVFHFFGHSLFVFRLIECRRRGLV